jgi:hypothetical protein
MSQFDDDGDKTVDVSKIVADLERKVLEAKAAQVHNYHFADANIDKASTRHLMGSGVIMTLTFLGGKTVMEPVLIREGLSEATIAAIKADFKRSYDLAIMWKPKG